MLKHYMKMLLCYIKQLTYFILNNLIYRLLIGPDLIRVNGIPNNLDFSAGMVISLLTQLPFVKAPNEH